jgi:hypothetical protein
MDHNSKMGKKTSKTGNNSFLFSEMDERQVPLCFYLSLPMPQSPNAKCHTGMSLFLQKLFTGPLNKKCFIHGSTNVIYAFKNGNL